MYVTSQILFNLYNDLYFINYSDDIHNKLDKFKIVIINFSFIKVFGIDLSCLYYYKLITQFPSVIFAINCDESYKYALSALERKVSNIIVTNNQNILNPLQSIISEYKLETSLFTSADHLIHKYFLSTHTSK